MQTFLPVPDFKESAKILDYRRLGKQRVEAMQLLNAIDAIINVDFFTIGKNGKKRKRSWINHPCTKMWIGYEDALAAYMNTCIDEWIRRGYKNTMKKRRVPANYKMPWWFGDEKFHASHRSNLLRKNPDYYGQFGWEESTNMEYVWPTKRRKTCAV